MMDNQMENPFEGMSKEEIMKMIEEQQRKGEKLLEKLDSGESPILDANALYELGWGAAVSNLMMRIFGNEMIVIGMEKLASFAAACSALGVIVNEAGEQVKEDDGTKQAEIDMLEAMFNIEEEEEPNKQYDSEEN